MAEGPCILTVSQLHPNMDGPALMNHLCQAGPPPAAVQLSSDGSTASVHYQDHAHASQAYDRMSQTLEEPPLRVHWHAPPPALAHSAKDGPPPSTKPHRPQPAAHHAVQNSRSAAKQAQRARAKSIQLSGEHIPRLQPSTGRAPSGPLPVGMIPGRVEDEATPLKTSKKSFAPITHSPSVPHQPPEAAPAPRGKGKVRYSVRDRAPTPVQERKEKSTIQRPLSTPERDAIPAVLFGPPPSTPPRKPTPKKKRRKRSKRSGSSGLSHARSATSSQHRRHLPHAPKPHLRRRSRGHGPFSSSSSLTHNTDSGTFVIHQLTPHEQEALFAPTRAKQERPPVPSVDSLHKVVSHRESLSRKKRQRLRRMVTQEERRQQHHSHEPPSSSSPSSSSASHSQRPTSHSHSHPKSLAPDSASSAQGSPAPPDSNSRDSNVALRRSPRKSLPHVSIKSPLAGKQEKRLSWGEEEALRQETRTKSAANRRAVKEALAKEEAERRRMQEEMEARHLARRQGLSAPTPSSSSVASLVPPPAVGAGEASGVGEEAGRVHGVPSASLPDHVRQEPSPPDSELPLPEDLASSVAAKLAEQTAGKATLPRIARAFDTSHSKDLKPLGGRATARRRPPTRRAHLSPAPARQYEEMRLKETPQEREAREAHEQELRSQRQALMAGSGPTSPRGGPGGPGGMGALNLQELQGRLAQGSGSGSLPKGQGASPPTKKEALPSGTGEEGEGSQASSVTSPRKKSKGLMHRLTKHTRKEKREDPPPLSSLPAPAEGDLELKATSPRSPRSPRSHRTLSPRALLAKIPGMPGHHAGSSK